MRRALLFVLAACGSSAPPPQASPPRVVAAPAPVPDEDAIVLSDVPYAPEWQKTSFGSYLAPSHALGPEVDVMFHFHFGREADDEWRTSRLDAIVVSVTLGMGSAPYDRAMKDETRFGRWIDEVLASVAEERRSGPLRLRRLGIVSFSAGFGAVGRILSRDAARIDTLVLLDSLHTYFDKAKRPDPSGIEPYIAFANEAKAGRKVMVVTHSSIKPIGYPSSTATTDVLLEQIGVDKRPAHEVVHDAQRLYRADAGNFHAFGYEGHTAKDHMKHLWMVGDLVREYVARRWTHSAMLERKEASR